ncbi:MAG: DUF5654 family protein [Candidatus Colwellbacteria bacterium]|jgi:hypothetical protein|nr:DUF5654 family protein [Candidatus Colwellbacteria bacterium]MCK9497392.1 DUF5654 family protein [Candidatus Colwellbacteria bacterium]MDD3752557.1 DUF5654 family protein [Candidatus Colwellbacteria bacterium]MDD4818948.1 DUF5654 family protein [Candidatus Colwellbacteria bacterium]
MGINEKLTNIKKKSAEFKSSVRERAVGYIMAAFGLVAGLAWNDAIKALIEELFPLSKETLVAKFIYAVIISALVVLVAYILVKASANEKDES